MRQPMPETDHAGESNVQGRPACPPPRSSHDHGRRPASRSSLSARRSGSVTPTGSRGSRSMMRKRVRECERERPGDGPGSPHRHADAFGRAATHIGGHLPAGFPRMVLLALPNLVAMILFASWYSDGSAPSAAHPSGSVDRRRTRGSPPLERPPQPPPSRIHPRVVDGSSLLSGPLMRTGTNRTASHDVRRSRRSIRYPMSTVEPPTSKDYRSGRADPMETDECRPNAPWQTQSYPTCNTLHELALSGPFSLEAGRAGGRGPDGRDLIRLVNNGFWRDVWVVPDYDLQPRVVKTLRYEHPCSPRNVERNRRDAMALERLTASRHVVGVYGYCSTSALFEFSDGGDIHKELWSDKNMTSVRKLQIATQAAMGLADAHTVDFEDRATIAHTDIAGNQYILIDGIYKLNDFNRARFLLRNKTTGENCHYFVGKNPGKNRSPEEYRYAPQSEKVDVYSFGNILYTLLQREFPFEDVSSKVARQRVMNGYRPPIYEDVWNSTDLATQALKKAMIACHTQDPAQRTSMRQVTDFLKSSLELVDPGRLEQWDEAR